MTEKEIFVKDEREKINEISFVYEGDSFNEGFDIEDLSNNLSAIHTLIEEIFDVAKEEGIASNSSSDIKEILFKPEKGSFIENIVVNLSNPEVRGLVFTIIVGLVFYLLGKKDNQKKEERVAQKVIDKLLASLNTDILRGLYEPIRKSKTNTLSIRSKTSNYILIKNENVSTLDSKMQEISEINNEVIEENSVSGYICAINVDTKNLRFHPHGDTRSYPLTFKGDVKKLIKRVDKKENYMMKIRKINGIIKSFELIDKSNKFKQLNEY